MAVLLSAIGFVPLFGGPGYEHALASGLVVPSSTAIATALQVSSLDVAASPLLGLAWGLGCGAELAALAFATALAHGARVGLCDLSGGALLFLLTAAIGSLLAGVWGAVVGEVCRGRRHRRTLAVALALAGPLMGVAISVARFYASPMIFAFDPFFGYFSGALYDTVVDVRPELWSYRAGSIATLVGAILIASALTRRNGLLALRVSPGHRRSLACLGAGAVALAASVGASVEGSALGHWQTAATIAATLGGRTSGPRCDVVHPDSLSSDQRALLLRDCEQELASVEGILGTRDAGRLTIFAFADADQKRRLMGAAETSIAKPWRREVYVQLGPYPHPVLGHEIAHVVAGAFAPGLFHVGGTFLPNPGLIEGVAVAASPDDDELSTAQWARAMLDLGILPPLRSLFSLGFLGESAAKSYTVAGAFVGWVLDEYGAATVRAWYGGGNVERLTGHSWEALEAAFRVRLLSLSMPPAATAYAKARFGRPSVWARRCPHRVDALEREADQCRDAHRFERAVDLYSRATQYDGDDWRARFEGARLDLRFLNAARGRAALTTLVGDERAPQTWRDRSEEALADDDLVAGRLAGAEGAYVAIAARTLDEDAARTLEVKALSVYDARARRAVIDLLIGTPGRSVDPWLAAVSLGEWMALTETSGEDEAGSALDLADVHDGPKSAGLARYLIGKNQANHEAWARAATTLDEALELPPPTARVGRELLRVRAACACALGDVATLDRVGRALRAEDSPFAGASGGRRDAIERLIARCKSPPSGP